VKLAVAFSQEKSMLTAPDPKDMTPDERRSEIACIPAAGFVRLGLAAGKSFHICNELLRRPPNWPAWRARVW
jgi:hypothetical protein